MVGIWVIPKNAILLKLPLGETNQQKTAIALSIEKEKQNMWNVIFHNCSI